MPHCRQAPSDQPDEAGPCGIRMALDSMGAPDTVWPLYLDSVVFAKRMGCGNIGWDGVVDFACPWVDTSGTGQVDFTRESGKSLAYAVMMRDKVYAE